ncbi:MAG: CoA transferase [Novosphingobium sp.]|nr:CoA transferase [Novosphingobium sp.]
MKILDLSCDVAGRFGAKLFAAAGEEVLRCAPDAGEETLSLYLDAEKQRIEPAELAAILPECDLVWTSFDRGQYLGHAAGLRMPEDCVHVTTSSFGTSGPYSSWRGGSMADWAAGGYLYITGDPDREPLSGPENLCAYAAGYTAAAGAEAALIDRIRTGRGRHLDVSTMEAMLLLHQSTFSRTQAGELRRRTGRFTEVYPLTVLPCRDGHVSIGVVSDAEFDKLAIAIGRPELSADTRFSDRDLRWKHQVDLDRELAQYLAGHDADDVVEALQTGGVACAKVAGPVDITSNPQLVHRGFWHELPSQGVMPGYPLSHFHPFAATDVASPPLGEGGDLPLSGVRVLDFTIFWAGPSATRTLADLGAEVIWVEQPGVRLDCHIEEGASASPFELMFHLHDTKMFRGKRSITLDLSRDEDRSVAHALARQAHIVVENFRPGVAGKLGVGPGDLAAINPALSYVSLSGWGADGPWADWRSYGPSIEAASSIEGRTGYSGGEPLRLGHTLPDATGGLIGALAALRGLRQSLATGAGGWFDISQLEAYAAMAGEGIIEATRHGRGTERVGNRSRFGALQGVFPCRGEDQWIAIRLDGSADRSAFSAFSGIDVAALRDPDEAEAAIAAFTRPYEKAELAGRLQAAGMEAFPVMDALELLDDRHLAEREFFLETEAGDRVCLLPGTPLVADPPMALPAKRAPRPGEHSREVRAGIGALPGLGGQF